jgi:hypothetical protein
VSKRGGGIKKRSREGERDTRVSGDGVKKEMKYEEKFVKKKFIERGEYNKKLGGE